MGPTTEDKQAKAQELADRLLGTADSAPDYLYDDLELCNELDVLVMLCPGCDWWVETSETDDEGFCEDCSTVDC